MSDPAALPGTTAPVLARPEITERRLHPSYLLISAGQTLRALIPVIVGVSVWRAHWWVAAVAAGVVAVLAVVQWWTHRYSVADGALRVRTGLLSRTVLTVPISRITSLDARRGVVQRLIGVWALHVQTPGDGRHATVRLHCLSGRALEELRHAVDPRFVTPTAGNSSAGSGAAVLPAGAASPAPQEISPGVVVAVLGTRELLIAALTGTSVPLLLAGGAAAWNRAHDLLPESSLSWVRREILGRGSATLLILVVLLVLAAAVAVTLTSLRLARFTLVREPGRLVITRGLIAQRSSTVPVDRVQAVRVVEGLWRRPLGYCSLEVEVAGVAGEEQDRALFPLLKRSQVAGFLHRALPELGWDGGAPTRVSTAARRRYPTLGLLAALPPAVALAFLPGWWALLALAPLIAAVLIGLAQARTASWSLDEKVVLLRWHRVLATHIVIARTRRVQVVRLTTTPMQRRARMAGITLSLSSARKARLRQVDATDAALLLHVVGRRQAVMRASAAESRSQLPART